MSTTINRRSFLKLLATIGITPSMLEPLLKAAELPESIKDRHIISIFRNGGPSSAIPYSGKAFIDNMNLLAVTKDLAQHPTFNYTQNEFIERFGGDTTQRLYDNGRLTLFMNSGNPEYFGNKNHADNQTLWKTGLHDASSSGYFTKVADKLSESGLDLTDPFTFLQINGSTTSSIFNIGDMVISNYTPQISGDDPDNNPYTGEGNYNIEDELNLELLKNSAKTNSRKPTLQSEFEEIDIISTIFDRVKDVYENIGDANYPNTSISDSAKMAVSMIVVFNSRLISLESVGGGNDDHQNMYRNYPSRESDIIQMEEAMLDHLAVHNKQNVAIIEVGDFGRTTVLNSNDYNEAGTDHGHFQTIKLISDPSVIQGLGRIGEVSYVDNGGSRVYNYPLSDEDSSIFTPIHLEALMLKFFGFSHDLVVPGEEQGLFVN